MLDVDLRNGAAVCPVHHAADVEPEVGAEQLPLPPGEEGLPLVGESLAFTKNTHQFVLERAKKHGPIFRTHIQGLPTVILIGPDAARWIMHNENKLFASIFFYSFLTLVGGEDCLLGQAGATHKRSRRIISRVFHPKLLERYAVVMDRITTEFLQRWREQPEVSARDEMIQLAYEVAAEVLLGASTSAVKELGPDVQDLIAGLLSIPVNVPMTTYNKAHKARARIHAYLDKEIARRRTEQLDLPDGLGVLMKADERDGAFDGIELKNQVLLLMITANETVSATLCGFCMLTAQHPEILQELRAEQAELGHDLPLTPEKVLAALDDR